MPVLELENIAKHYGAIQALNGVSMSFEAGEVIGLVGDNGAGKSTLVKIIAGNFPQSSGTIKISGQPVHLHSPADARRAGIEIVYQDLALADNLTAAANIFLGREKLTPLGLLDYNGMYRRARGPVAPPKTRNPPPGPAGAVSGGGRPAHGPPPPRPSNPKIVLRDEPPAAISVRQVAEVLNLIRRLKEQGMVVVLISHRIPDISAVCDRLVVLRRGRKVADKRIADSSPEEVTGLITGAIENAMGAA